MNAQFLVLIRLSVLVLMPVVPAFLLFKALPSKAIVSGPFQGLRINLGGSFAAYFVILLILISSHSVWNPVLVEVWSVDGNVLDEAGNPIPGLLSTDISVNPPPVSIIGPGAFHLEVATELGPTGDSRYPSITISRDNLRPTLIHLEPAKSIDSANLKIDWDANRQRVQISRIVLRPLPAYNAAGAPPPLVTPSRQP